MPLGPCQPLLRAQNDFRLALSDFDVGCGAGAFKCDPVAALYFALPFAVKPPPCLTESFSCLLTEREHLQAFVICGFFFF